MKTEHREWNAVAWIRAAGVAGACMVGLASSALAEPLAGTAPLTMEGDLASAMVDGIDGFLLREIAQSPGRRAQFWTAEPGLIETNRTRLARILGLRDPRAEVSALELVATTAQPALVGESKLVQVFAVRWPCIGDVRAEGLLLRPVGRAEIADAIVLPDAGQTPEMLAGLAPGVPAEAQFARRLAESGCRVLVPLLVDRSTRKERAATLTNREYIYRQAFELGRHLTGYELQMALTGVDWFVRDAAAAPRRIGVWGWGEGGRLALLAAALDTRIGVAGVSGYFGPREGVWQEPLDRNVFSLLERFGDAEIARLVAPRPLVVEACRAPEFEVPAGTGGGPGRLGTPPLEDVRREIERAAGLPAAAQAKLVVSGDGAGPFGSEAMLKEFLALLAPGVQPAAPGEAPSELRKSFDPAARQAALVDALTRHSQQVLSRSADERRELFRRLDTGSLPRFRETVEEYRRCFRDEVIGSFDQPLLPPAVRTREAYGTEKYRGYEVVLDVFPQVIAYGILLVPRDLAAGERRPVVVCQHGLEGRPQDTLRDGKRAYAGFASALADRGFVVFAPQNPYIFGDRFRTLQRKANPLGKTLFSVIVPQHRQIVDWLGTLPFADRGRIAFYGLSYGGKTAMRVPALVTNYCLSICSGDFNEWVWKNASVGNNYTYVGTGEYEIFEFDLGGTFNYAEMAALIAPRPFMVERGHFDGVAPDETVAYEFAKVRHLYQAKLGIGDRVAIEWFPGPHEIHGVGTYDFLHRHLDWPKR